MFWLLFLFSNKPTEKRSIMNLKNKITVTISACAFVLIFSSNQASAQVGIGTTTPDKSAALDVKATDKGFLAPRLTKAQRDAINAPANGLLIFQTDNNPGLYYYTNAQWQAVVDNMGNHMATQNLKLNGNWISNSGVNNGLRLTNDGNAGIGIERPEAKLDVNGDIKFLGPLLPNGHAGSDGQVLTSKGQGQAPEWKSVPSATATIYNNLLTDISKTSLVLYPPAGTNLPVPYATKYEDIPGLTREITLTSPAKVIVSCDGGLFTLGTLPNSFSNVDVVIMMNGQPLPIGGFRRVVAQNNAQLTTAVSSWAMSSTVDLPAGKYTFSVKARLIEGQPAEMAGNTQPMQGLLQTLVIGN